MKTPREAIALIYKRLEEIGITDIDVDTSEYPVIKITGKDKVAVDFVNVNIDIPTPKEPYHYVIHRPKKGDRW